VVPPQHDRLLRELRSLERRVHRSGKDSVDHPSHGSDDYANAVCGALYVAVSGLRKPKLRVGTVDVDGYVHWKGEEHVTRFRHILVDGKTGETIKESVSVRPTNPRYVMRG
jgi:hypothetical protein